MNEQNEDVTTTTYRVLSFWQPQASHVARQPSMLIARAWGTEYRGPAVIHAVAGQPLPPAETRELSTPGISHEILNFPLPQGVILATCQLVDCLPHFDRSEPLPEGCIAQGQDLSYVWKLEDIKTLVEPVPMNGVRDQWESPRGWEPAFAAAWAQHVINERVMNTGAPQLALF